MCAVEMCTETASQTVYLSSHNVCNGLPRQRSEIGVRFYGKYLLIRRIINTK